VSEEETDVDAILRGRGVEVVKGDEASPAWVWSSQVWEAYRNKCASCGGKEKLRASLIVPEGAGGARDVRNSVLLCRTCEFARDLINRPKTPGSGHTTRPINFWISSSLYAKLKNGLSHDYGFKSLASLVRFLMSTYVSDVAHFNDVENYLDRGADVKINVWVPKDTYAIFQTITTKHGSTVTDTLRGLLRMYESETDRVFGKGTEL
jgi:hypothetical protein